MSANIVIGVMTPKQMVSAIKNQILGLEHDKILYVRFEDRKRIDEEIKSLEIDLEIVERVVEAMESETPNALLQSA